MSFYSDEDKTHYHKKVLPRFERCGVWNLVVGYWVMSSWWGIFVEENNPGYLKMEFLENYCSFSRLITKQDNVLLEFTTARLIAIYDSVLLQFAIAWLLQFSTTVITIYDRYYNSRHYYSSRLNKVPRSNYYASKVNHLKQTKPSQWWSALKWIADMALVPGSDPLFANLQIEGSALLSEQEIVNEINSVFL